MGEKVTRTVGADQVTYRIGHRVIATVRLVGPVWHIEDKITSTTYATTAGPEQGILLDLARKVADAHLRVTHGAILD